MTFQEYMNRPVYKAQCHSWSVAVSMGLRCAYFRVLPKYRNAAVLSDRKAVADTMRRHRDVLKQLKDVQQRLDIAQQHNPATGFSVDCMAVVQLRPEMHKLQDQVTEYKRRLVPVSLVTKDVALLV